MSTDTSQLTSQSRKSFLPSDQSLSRLEAGKEAGEEEGRKSVPSLIDISISTLWRLAGVGHDADVTYLCAGIYRTAGYCCEVQIFATLLKWPLAEISAIKNFSLPAEIFASLTFIRKFRKNLDLAHITRCTVCVSK